MTVFLRINEVMSRTGLSRRTIYRYSASGNFPAQRRLGGRAYGWVEDEVEGWLMARRHGAVC